MSVATGTVPFVDLERQHRPLAGELREAFAELVESGDFTLGEAVESFEAEFAAHVGVPECVGVASGTAALTLALQALEIGRGDEVIVPAHTFVASALAVSHAGAEPVLCDVDPATGLIDPAAAAAVAGPRTAAVIAVHLYGQTCEIAPLERFARARGLALVEDAAQAHGATDGNRRAGSLGDAAAFSFYPSKNLGALGDAGAVCTSDAALGERIRMLRNLGQRRKGEHELPGWNERLDSVQAACLRVKLPHLDSWNASRREAAERYRALLPEAATPLPDRDGAAQVFHLFPVRVADRDAVAERMRAGGIGVGVHYSPPLHHHAPLRSARRGELHEAEGWAREELSLPIFPGITEEEVGVVCRRLRQALDEGSSR